jgi:hypothetical protein
MESAPIIFIEVFMGKIMRPIISFLATIPALLGGLVPVFKACPPCPVCMPIYCAILSIIGLELADYGAYLVPIMLVSMALTIGSIIYQTRYYHKNILLCSIAIFACSSILVGKFVLDLLPMVYIGMGSLASVIFLNRQAVRAVRKACCPH